MAALKIQDTSLKIVVQFSEDCPGDTSPSCFNNCFCNAGEKAVAVLRKGQVAETD